MKYDLIYSDVPKAYQNWTDKKHGSPRQHYNVMSIKELCDLPVQQIAADNSCLLHWSSGPKLKDDIQIMESWGFEFITCIFVWNKIYKNGKSFCGLGFYSRSGTEFVLLGKRGKGLKRISNSVRQVITAPSTRPHSSKPNIEVRKRIDELFGKDIKKIELFARPPIPSDWMAIGLEIDNLDIHDSLQKIIGDPNAGN
jgi:site-specific DNA-methyltransferase (adenine-specific)